ncbi:hypothetical protein O1611_g8700 [Lasiodiplodia mahajangana]|uniref:Uncharacterized protein n=1 Tax=Lasiodiplodia mahajangana TaxID=1108764 RepID=A0ACC2JBT1_9PEZI|nr:hypothetical protein O1611_g8700 [Lasiodiplodia mahajangana]
MGTNIQIDVDAREVSTVSTNLRPASDIEILGVATATCLLAFFICSVLWTGLRRLRRTYSPELDRSGTHQTTMTSSKRDGATPSIRKWSSIPSIRSRDGSSEQQQQQQDSQTSRSTNSASNKRMKISWKNHVISKQYYYTQMAARCKPASRKPLLLPNSTIASIRWKDTTLDMEEGLSLRSNAVAAATNSHDDFSRLKRLALRGELQEKNVDDLKISFLPCRIASL